MTDPVQHQTMTTYKRADGECVGDYGWVTDLEFFEDDWEPSQLIKEVWVRQSVEEITNVPIGWKPPEDDDDE